MKKRVQMLKKRVQMLRKGVPNEGPTPPKLDSKDVPPSSEETSANVQGLTLPQGHTESAGDRSDKKTATAKRKKRK